MIGPDVSLGHILDDLSLIWETTEDEEWIDIVWYLPFSGQA